MDNKNLILAIVLSVMIMVGFQYVYETVYPPAPPTPTLDQQAADGAEPTGDAATPAVPAAPPPAAEVPSAPPGAGMGAAAPPSPVEARARTITGDRVRIDTPRVHGSIALTGARIDDITLADYQETLDPQSPEIVIFSPPASANTYFAETGWISSDPDVPVPGPQTEWTADRSTLSPGMPVTLSWDNGAGLTFEKIISVDENYLFTITQRVEGTLPQPVTVTPYNLVSRHGTPEVSMFWILHEGPIGVFNGTLKEVDYSDLQEDGSERVSSTGGWIGITDKYWLAAVIPDQQERIAARFFHQSRQGQDQYQVDFVGQPRTLTGGEAIESTSRLFVGAKEVRLLDGYEETYGITNFDLAIDFGWFYFLTKPIFYLLIWINDVVGNLGVAILLLTVAIKLVFFPLANKSYRAMSLMRKLQPEMMKLRERFGDDRMKLNQEMMALYKREKVNPASGCLPILIQIPVFFALYKVLFVTIETRHAPFFGWIQDLSVPDPTTIWNLFGLIPWDPSGVIPGFLSIGIWPLIMGASMYLQQKLNPQPPDPLQAKIFLLLPIVFTFLLAQFPAGLVIYWAWNNTLSILQQWVIMRRMGVKP